MPDNLLSSDPQAGVLLSSDPNAGAMEMESGEPKGGGTNSALMAHLLPLIQRGIEDFATNPNVPRMAAKGGKAIGAVTSLPASMGGFGDISKGAWNGSRAGWFTGKLAQDVTGYVAELANKLEPYLRGLSPAVGAQGVLDLAQMAEPDRQDIGLLGIGQPAQPPTVQQSQRARKNQEQAELGYLKNAMSKGMTAQQAAIQLANGNSARLAEIMNLYIKSGGR